MQIQYLPSLLQDPWFHARASVLVGWVALTCLVAIWAGISRRHWLFGALAVWATVAILVAIAAYELAWLFAASSSLIVAMLWVSNRREGGLTIATSSGEQPVPVKRFRYGLRDLLMIMVIVGLWLVVAMQVVRHYVPDNFYGWLVSSFGLASIAVLAYGCVANRRRWSTVALLVCAVPAIALAVWSAGNWLGIGGLINVSGKSKTVVADLILMSLTGAELALTLILATSLASASMSPRRPVRWRVFCGTVLVAGVVIAAVPLGYIYIRLLERSPRVPKFEIAGNHYDRILVIAEQIQSLNPQNVSLSDLALAAPGSKAPQQVEAFYGELLPLLQFANAVDFDPDRDSTMNYARGQLGRVQTFRALARCLNAESERARESNESDSAADYALAELRLGTMLRRGATSIEALVGIAIDSMGQSQLAKLRGDLSSTQSRVVVTALRQSLGECEDVEVIFARGAYFDQQAFGWQGRLEDVLDEWNPHVVSGIASFRRSALHWAAVNILLQADLAIRAYEREKGRLPNDLRQLVPEYLPAVPQDPYAERPLVYRRKDRSFDLYSVGFDGHDNSGNFVSRSDYHNAQLRGVPGLDLDLETLVRPD